MAMDMHNTINQSIEISNKQMMINKALLDNLDISSSESEHDSSIMQNDSRQFIRRNGSELVISQPISFTTSNVLTDEIDQLWKLIKELKAINEVGVSKNTSTFFVLFGKN